MITIPEIIDKIVLPGSFVAGMYFSTKTKKSVNYKNCLHCKYMVVRGTQTRSDRVDLYCLHPSNELIRPVDRVLPDFYCGNFEVTEAYAVELFKEHSEKILKSSKKSLKKVLQDKLHR